MSTGDVYGPDTADAPIMAFPEPHVFRATSAQARSSQTPQRMVHRYSRSDLGSSRSDLQALHHNSSVVSFASSYNGQNDDYEPGSTEASLWSTIFTCSHIFVQGYENDTAEIVKGLSEVSCVTTSALFGFADSNLFP